MAAREASSSSTHLAVADTSNHTVTLLVLRGLAVQSSQIFGRPGVAGHVDGAGHSIVFNEPLALSYSCGVLHIGCYGGELHGVVSALTPVEFAVETLRLIKGAYEAIGFVHSKATAAQRAVRHPPIRTAIQAVRACAEHMRDIAVARNKDVGLPRGAEGPEGTWPLYQIEGMLLTANSAERLVDDLVRAGVDITRVVLGALVNESGVERSFGHGDRATQCAPQTPYHQHISLPEQCISYCFQVFKSNDGAVRQEETGHF